MSPDRLSAGDQAAAAEVSYDPGRRRALRVIGLAVAAVTGLFESEILYETAYAQEPIPQVGDFLVSDNVPVLPETEIVHPVKKIGIRPWGRLFKDVLLQVEQTGVTVPNRKGNFTLVKAFEPTGTGPIEPPIGVYSGGRSMYFSESSRFLIAETQFIKPRPPSVGGIVRLGAIGTEYVASEGVTILGSQVEPGKGAYNIYGKSEVTVIEDLGPELIVEVKNPEYSTLSGRTKISRLDIGRLSLVSRVAADIGTMIIAVWQTGNQLAMMDRQRYIPQNGQIWLVEPQGTNTGQIRIEGLGWGQALELPFYANTRCAGWFCWQREMDVYNYEGELMPPRHTEVFWLPGVGIFSLEVKDNRQVEVELIEKDPDVVAEQTSTS